MSYLSDAAWTQEERPDFYDGDDYDEEEEEEVAFAPLTAGQEAKVRGARPSRREPRNADR